MNDSASFPAEPPNRIDLPSSQRHGQRRHDESPATGGFEGPSRRRTDAGISLGEPPAGDGFNGEHQSTSQPQPLPGESSNSLGVPDIA